MSNLPDQAIAKSNIDDVDYVPCIADMDIVDNIPYDYGRIIHDTDELYTDEYTDYVNGYNYI